MAWKKAKVVLVTTIAVLMASTLVVVIRTTIGASGMQSQRLVDGSLLVLNRVSFGTTNTFVHGSTLEKLLKHAIPTNGLRSAKFSLKRPTEETFGAAPGKSWLIAELRIVGTNLANHPLVKSKFGREFRCVIRGESGIEYAEEIWPEDFQHYSDGYFGYVMANSYPRDSPWLWLRVEQRKNRKAGAPWQSLAEFKFKNKARPTIQPWTAKPAPASNKIGGMDFVLNQITVVTQSYSARDIWNHLVTAPFQFGSNGVRLTNWLAAYTRVEDASGNWNYNLQSHRSLDPRFVWKLEADFEPESDFPPGSVVTIDLAKRNTPTTTNLQDVPVTIFWDGKYIRCSMLPNRPDLALKFVSVTDEQGNEVTESSGNWSQYEFYRGYFYVRGGGLIKEAGKLTKVTFAIVPNVRATFYAQPRVMPGELN